MSDDRILDRTANHDLRSYSYVRTDLAQAPVTTRFWNSGLSALDQGSVGACTGFGWSQAVSAMPGMSATNRKRVARNAYALATYVLATNFDQYPGQYPVRDTGSDTNSAARAMKDLGWVGRWEWLTTVEAIAGALSIVGPVVVGTNWTKGMFTVGPSDYPDLSGIPTIKLTGAVAGGHCYALVGVIAEIESLVLRNSWGTKWGTDGVVTITYADFAQLLVDGGDAALPHLDHRHDPVAGLA